MREFAKSHFRRREAPRALRLVCAGFSRNAEGAGLAARAISGWECLVPQPRR